MIRQHQKMNITKVIGLRLDKWLWRNNFLTPVLQQEDNRCYTNPNTGGILSHTAWKALNTKNVIREACNKSVLTEQTYEYSFWLSVCKSGRSAFPRNWFISDAKFSDSSSLMLERVMTFSSIWWESIESEVENNAICVMCAANNIRRKWCSLWCELDWTVYSIFLNHFHEQYNHSIRVKISFSVNDYVPYLKYIFSGE